MDSEYQLIKQKTLLSIDEYYGYYDDCYEYEKIGWLINIQPTVCVSEKNTIKSCVNYYFLENNGRKFKCTLHYNPYFYLKVDPHFFREIVGYLNRKFQGIIYDIKYEAREDLDAKPDHLFGSKTIYLKLLFENVQNLMKVKKMLNPIIRRNKEFYLSQDVFTNRNISVCNIQVIKNTNTVNTAHQNNNDDLIATHILDMLEYDVPYYIRVSIDLKIFVGHWYKVKTKTGQEEHLNPEIVLIPDLEERPEPIILAFDIETTKAPLKFPDENIDQIMMISYMIDGQGYLITNRQIVSKDIDNFDYNPTPEFSGHFKIFNEEDEIALINRFITHIHEVQPSIIVTYNGDFFDWPFVVARARIHGIDVFKVLGFSEDSQKNFTSRPCIHMDCLKWVKRDSYLPVGSQGLKSVAKLKLNYHPSELDPERMVAMAVENPQVLASYSVSDALATYYLYVKYIHSFIFSLCTIVPMCPDDVLRKGSGTLCETLLMVQAYHANIIFPNKHLEYDNLDEDDTASRKEASEEFEDNTAEIRGHHSNQQENLGHHSWTKRKILDSKSLGRPIKQKSSMNNGPKNNSASSSSFNRYKFTKDGYVLEQETYIGAHVEAIESGIFRCDIPMPFKLEQTYVDYLIANVGKIIANTIEQEEEISLTQITNFSEVCEQIETQLYKLKGQESITECPKIYHLDVGAMYPNIILTNRLQPYAIVNDIICAKCAYNVPGSDCQRPLGWKWRGEHMPINKTEAQRILLQLENESFVAKNEYNEGKQQGTIKLPFHRLPKEQRLAIEKQRLKDYSRRAYKRIKISKEEERVSVTCQRENSFYIDTIRAFRDRRYDFKNLVKSCNKKLAALKSTTAHNDPMQINDGKFESIKDIENKRLLYDSLQLAHKCILNSFYGYVMRKGARWFSMEMAGIVCLIGSNIIKEARIIIEKIGRPLELDTDGIWCALPSSLPENFTFSTKDPKKPKLVVSFIGALLNLMVWENFTNHQYQELMEGQDKRYVKRSENSIFFEVDGPYFAMILPSAKEEGKKLKKRYAVFNMDRSLAELKGFEVKRRGELPFLKQFQNSVFEAVLRGSTLEDAYKALGSVADYWLDFLYSKGANMSEEEIFNLVAENKSMSKRLDEYGDQKSTSINTAKRLAEFLGDSIIRDSKGGLNCCYIMSRKPEGAPLSERAVPYVIFQAEENVKRHYLRKWLKIDSFDDNGPYIDTKTRRVDIRAILDWDYYLERIGSAIQKIITIPAALQHIKNPVPRVSHPDWLHRKLMSITDVYKQKKINNMFSSKPNVNGGINGVRDMENLTNNVGDTMDGHSKRVENQRPWIDILGPAPKLYFSGNKNNFEEWLNYHKSKWRLQLAFRRKRLSNHNSDRIALIPNSINDGVKGKKNQTNLMAMLKTAAHKENERLFNYPWHVLQVIPTLDAGIYKVWAILDDCLKCLRVRIPRIFYVNQYGLKTEPKHASDLVCWEKVNGLTLPRGTVLHNLYRYTVSEQIFQKLQYSLEMDMCSPNIEGLYETNVPLHFQMYSELGCMWQLTFPYAKKGSFKNNKYNINTLNNPNHIFDFGDLKRSDNATHKNNPIKKYLPPKSVKYLYLYYRDMTNYESSRQKLQNMTHNDGQEKQQSNAVTKEFWALALPHDKKIYLYIYDKSWKTNTALNNSNITSTHIHLREEDAKKIYDMERKKLLDRLEHSYEQRRDEMIADDHNIASKSLEYMLPYPNHTFLINNIVMGTNTATNANKKHQTPQNISTIKQSSGPLTRDAIRKSIKTLLKQHSIFYQAGEDGINNGKMFGKITQLFNRGIDADDSNNQNGDKRQTLPKTFNTFLAHQCQDSLLSTNDSSITDHLTTTTDNISHFLRDIQNSIMPCIKIMNKTSADFGRLGELENTQTSLRSAWYNKAFLHMIGQYLSSPQILDLQLENARYIELPLGNLPNDIPITGCDLAFARKLRQNNCILWASPFDVPDLGGKEEGNVCLSIEDDINLFNATQSKVTTDGDTDYNVCSKPNTFNSPGFYRSICFEFHIVGLALNAVISYHRILENEGLIPALAFPTHTNVNSDGRNKITLKTARNAININSSFVSSADTSNRAAKKRMKDTSTTTHDRNLSSLIDSFNAKSTNRTTLDNNTTVIHEYYDGMDETLITENRALDKMVETETTTLFYDELANDSESFRALRNLLHTWVRDVAKDYNVFADNLIQHFYRWLKSSKSLMYEPSLAHAVNLLTQKLHQALYRELKKLDVTVIHSTFDTLIIECGKAEMSQALAYVQYIMKVLKDHPLFHGLTMQINYAWDILLWLDSSNYAGIKAKFDPNEHANANTRPMFSEPFSRIFIYDETNMNFTLNNGQYGNDSQNYLLDSLERAQAKIEKEREKVDMNWTLSRYLTVYPDCQYYFNMIIALYVMSTYDYLQQELILQELQEKDYSHQRNTFLNHSQDAENDILGQLTKNENPCKHLSPGLISHCQNVIANEFNEKIFKIMQKVQKTTQSFNYDPCAEPIDATKKIQATFYREFVGEGRNIALDLGNLICYVLGLDTIISQEVQKLKRNILTILNVKEFSDQADFILNHMSFILKEIICEHCLICRDLDVCQDITLDEDANELYWSCSCGMEFDKCVIENNIIHSMQQIMNNFLLQDISCIKCFQLKEDTMSKYCVCNGPYKTQINSHSLHKILATLRKVAKTFKMTTLMDLITSIFEYNI